MSYTMCPACGQHALKVANRCPRCGLPFEQQFFSRAQPASGRRRVPIALFVGGVLILLLGTAEWINRRKAASASRSAPGAATDSTATVSAATLVTPAPDTDSGTPPPAAKLPTPVAVGPKPESALKPAAPPVGPRQAPAPSGDRRSLAATDWVNVRARPSNASAIVGVLRPGEVVQIDSTTQGWYRTQAGRVPGGYVDRRLLESPRR